jgi:hypothetical protein
LLAGLAGMLAGRIDGQLRPPRHPDPDYDEDDWLLPGDDRLVARCRDCLSQELGADATGCGNPGNSRECWQRLTYRMYAAGQIPAGGYRQGRCLTCGTATHWAGTPHGNHEYAWQYCSDACYEIARAAFREGDETAKST